MHTLPIRTFPGWLVAFAILLSVSACSAGRSASFPADQTARQARDVPDHFLVGTLNSTETAEPVAGEGCRNPMVDPRDATRLRLVRSSAERGDYEVPGERYGVGQGELLRLECATGRVIGVVEQ